MPLLFFVCTGIPHFVFGPHIVIIVAIIISAIAAVVATVAVAKWEGQLRDPAVDRPAIEEALEPRVKAAG